MPLPRYVRFQEYVLDERGSESLVPRGNAFLAKASGETYLQLHANALDLDDADAIVDFANEYGLLMGFHGYEQFFDWLQFPPEDAAFVIGVGQDGLPRELLSSRPPARVLRATGHAGGRAGETLAEFRFAARCIRDLLAAWRLIKGEIEPRDLNWQIPFAEVMTPEDAPRILTRGLNAGLANLHPRLEPLPPERPERAQTETARGPALCLYELCCLELYTHIVSQAVHRRCANERCRKLFVTKNHGAPHRKSRTKGLKYCSDRCENAQLQRESRRRRSQTRQVLT